MISQLLNSKNCSKLNQKIPIITGNNLERKVTWCWTCRTIGASCMGRLFPFCECTPLLFFPFFTPCYSSVSASSPGILPSRPPPSLAPPPIKPQEQPVQSVAQQASKRSVAIFVRVTCESSAIYQCIEFYSNFPCKYLSEFQLVWMLYELVCWVSTEWKLDGKYSNFCFWSAPSIKCCNWNFGGCLNCDRWNFVFQVDCFRICSSWLTCEVHSVVGKCFEKIGRIRSIVWRKWPARSSGMLIIPVVGGLG